MAKISYKLTSREKDNLDYKKIFEAFGHTGSLMSLELFESLSEEQKSSVCTVYFMLNPDRSAQVLCPVSSMDAVNSSKYKKANAIIAMNKVIKTCEKHNFSVDSYISSTPESDLAELYHFEGETTKAEVEGHTFYQTERVQNQNENMITKSGEDLNQ